ncbi:MAG: hypothetical protein KO202_04450 [Methanobacteriaceae archaeon]|jgi:hypothetical protein|nr:hypothetical protein [Methanobacteriaceae archaeon]
MYDLILGFLFVTIIFIGLNNGFLCSNKNLNPKKTSAYSLFLFFIFIIVLILIKLFNINFNFLNSYLNIIFLIIAILLLLFSVILILNYKKDFSSYNPLILAIFSLFTLAIILNLIFANDVLFIIFLGLVLVISIFLSFFMSNLLKYAQKPFPLLISEFIILQSIFFFLSALTYDSIKNLDYSMFNSFLILTPTYKLIYIAIGIVTLLLIGLYLNDQEMKKKFR